MIDVPSVDEALRKVEAAGGKTVRKMPVGDMGFAGDLADTEGALIGRWETA